MGRLASVLSVVVTVAAFAAAIYSLDVDKIVAALFVINPSTVVIAAILLTASLGLAYLRFEWTLRGLGVEVARRPLVVAFTVGNLASQVLLNIVGQSFTRATVLRGAGVPVSTTIMATYIERLAATVTLGLAAIGAIIILFGSIHIDLDKGGYYFVQLAIGLPPAVLLGAGWAMFRLVDRKQLKPVIRIALRLWPTIVLGIAVQLATLGAYLVLIARFASGTDSASLVSALLIVMFVSSIPISLSGWGLREFSAAYVLSAIGIPAEAAVTMAVIVGTLSFLSGLTTSGIVGLTAWRYPPATKPVSRDDATGGSDLLLVWPVGILTACLIFFQLHVTVGDHEVTVNAADLLAITALFLGVYFAWTQGLTAFFPKWVAWSLGAIGLSLLLGGVVGWLEFGGNQWAYVNRILGFPVLAGYIATAALVVAVAGERGRIILGGVFVVAAATIITLEIGVWLINKYFVYILPYVYSIRHGDPEGYAQNRNAFAFQLLMVMPIIVSMKTSGDDRRAALIRICALCIVAGMVLFTGSRAGSLSAAIALVLTGLLEYVGIRKLLAYRWPRLLAIVVAALAFILLFVKVGVMLGWVDLVTLAWKSNETHWQEIKDGFDLWLQYPLLGAGLGAFIERSMSTGLGPDLVHNVPVWFMAELGLVGLAAYLSLVASLVHVGFRMALDDTSRARGYAIIVLLAIFIAMGMFHDIFYQRTFWFMVGLLVATSATASRVPEHS